jgi:hypothetical protein
MTYMFSIGVEFKLKGNPWCESIFNNDQAFYSCLLINALLKMFYDEGIV